jgi:hypothetical protein
MREQLSGAEISCLVYQRSAVWCIVEQLSGVPEINCLVYQRAAVWCINEQLYGVQRAAV